jgi:hypothetical protein
MTFVEQTGRLPAPLVAMAGASPDSRHKARLAKLHAAFIVGELA